MGHFKKHKLAKTITSLLTLLPIVSLAAETQDSEQQEQLALEKIIVTAQKRGENLQEVPLAISVLGSKQMDRGNIQNIQDIQHFLWLHPFLLLLPKNLLQNQSLF